MATSSERFQRTEPAAFCVDLLGQTLTRFDALRRSKYRKAILCLLVANCPAMQPNSDHGL